MSDKPDVLAELDAWLAWGDELRLMKRESVRRARDELVALKRALDGVVSADFELGLEAATQIRAEALEEAARFCELRAEQWPVESDTLRAVAVLLRGLKVLRQ